MLKSGLEAKREEFNRKFYVYTATLRSFATGVESSIINASLWFYLERFHANSIFFGVVLCLYQSIGVLSSVFFGRLYDETRRTKILVTISNAFQIIGNLIFSLGFSKYLVLFGRMICGVGEGFTPIVYAEVGSVFASSERLKIISLIEGGRVIGTIAGPLFNLAFVKVNVYVGKWHITYGATAGVVMVFFWILVSILCFIYIYDMYIVKIEKEKLKKTVKFSFEDEKGYVSDSEEEFIYNPKSNLLDKDDNHGGNTKPSILSTGIREALEELMTVEPLIIMTADAFFWLVFGGISALTPLVLTRDLMWDPVHVIIVYVVFSVIVAMSILILQYIHSVDDVAILLGLTIGVAFVGPLFILLQIFRGYKVVNVVLAMAITVFYGLFAGGNLVIGRTLLTKLISTENQGLSQGIYNVWVGLATALGPLIGSLLYHHLEIWGSLLTIVYLSIAAFIHTFKLRIRERKLNLEEENVDFLQPKN